MQYSKPIAITRTLESKGKKYVYGYAAIFDSPDAHGTIMTKGLVESNLPRLRKYPALRLNHRIPLGQLVFDREVEGIKTFVDEHGFHVLAQVYDKFEDEWRMIQKGGWGFSYGFMPSQHGATKTVCVTPNECYKGFISGTLYEISVVDTPSHFGAKVHTIERMLTDKRQQVICTKTCEFGFSCANLNTFEQCLGYELKPNHDLKRYLDAGDRLSLTRYIEMIHQTQSPSIKRELSKVVERFIAPEEKLFTMRGMEVFRIMENENGSKSLAFPEREPKPRIRQNPIPLYKLDMLSKNQRRVKRGENSK